MAVEADKVVSEIQKVVSEDPTIREANRLLVNVEKRGLFGLKGEVVALAGSVHSQSDKLKMEKIASLHSGGRKIDSQIQVVG